MKIIKKPNSPPATRNLWIEGFLGEVGSRHAKETPTNYRDAGGSVRFLFTATGAEAEWDWKNIDFKDAVLEATEAGLVKTP